MEHVNPINVRKLTLTVFMHKGKFLAVLLILPNISLRVQLSNVIFLVLNFPRKVMAFIFVAAILK